jgi:hypothetical protein
MKKILLIIIIAVIYFIVIYFYSMLFGLPPFNRGIIIGYPAIYYEFYIDSYKQHGFKNILNLILNLIIIVSIYIFYNFIRKRVLN